jgi:hypothetical protein
MSKITSSEYQAGYKAGYADAHREALENFKSARNDALEEAAKHLESSADYIERENIYVHRPDDKTMVPPMLRQRAFEIRALKDKQP